MTAVIFPHRPMSQMRDARECCYGKLRSYSHSSIVSSTSSRISHRTTQRMSRIGVIGLRGENKLRVSHIRDNGPQRNK